MSSGHCYFLMILRSCVTRNCKIKVAIEKDREESWLRSLVEQDKSGSAWIGSAGEFLYSGLTDLFKKQVIIIRKNF